MPSKCHTALAAPGKCSVRNPPPLSRSNTPVKPHSSPGGGSKVFKVGIIVICAAPELLPTAVDEPLLPCTSSAADADMHTSRTHMQAQMLTWQRPEVAQFHGQQVAGLRQLPLSILHVDRAAEVVHLDAG